MARLGSPDRLRALLVDPGALSAFILERIAPRGVTRVDESTSLVESGWLDSFGVVDLVVFLEREFGVVLRDEDVIPENFETLETIHELVHRATRR